MKVIKKESKSTYYDIDEICCKEMKRHIKKGNITFRNGYSEFNLIMDNQFSLETLSFNFCPWCGEKIE